VLAALESGDGVLWHLDTAYMSALSGGTVRAENLLEAGEDVVGVGDLASLRLYQLLCSAYRVSSVSFDNEE
jgi:hypothetical protein